MTRRQKKRMVQFLFGAAAVLCIGMLIGTVYAKNQETEAKEKEEQILLPDVLEEDEEKIIGTKEEEQEENLPEDWNLILVNKNHLVPEDYEVELKAIGSGHYIDERAYDDFRAMIQAAKKEGIYIYVTSSYRSMDKQVTLHNKKIEHYVMKGYSYAEAKRLAAEVVAIPGTSEHQLGLALDLVSSEYRKLDEKQETTRGFKWLKEHCAEYGFILRYPNGETEMTGIIYEPWHFRYVGKEAAAEITEAGLTLEEYVGARPVGNAPYPELSEEYIETLKKHTPKAYLNSQRTAPPVPPQTPAPPVPLQTSEPDGQAQPDTSPVTPITPEAPPALPEEPPASGQAAEGQMVE